MYQGKHLIELKKLRKNKLRVFLALFILSFTLGLTQEISAALNLYISAV